MVKSVVGERRFEPQSFSLDKIYLSDSVYNLMQTFAHLLFWRAITLANKMTQNEVKKQKTPK